jgi:hypothetical protein
LGDRIKMPRAAFQKLYMRSLNRLLEGIGSRCPGE